MSDSQSKPVAVFDTSYIMSYVLNDLWTIGVNKQLQTLEPEVIFPQSVVEEYMQKQKEDLVDDCGNPLQLPDLTEETPDFVRGVRRSSALEKVIVRQWRRTPKGKESQHLHPSQVDADVMALAVERSQERTTLVVTGDWDIVDTIERINREQKLGIQVITPGRIPLKYFEPIEGQVFITTPVLKQLRELKPKVTHYDSNDKVSVLFERARLMGYHVDIGYAVDVTGFFITPKIPENEYAMRVLGIQEATNMEELGSNSREFVKWCKRLIKKEGSFRAIIKAENAFYCPILVEFETKISEQGKLEVDVEFQDWHRLDMRATLYEGLGTKARQMLLDQGITIESLNEQKRQARGGAGGNGELAAQTSELLQLFRQ